MSGILRLVLLALLLSPGAGAQPEESSPPSDWPPTQRIPGPAPGEARAQRPPTSPLPAPRAQSRKEAPSPAPIAGGPEDMQRAMEENILRMSKGDPKAFAEQKKMTERQRQIREIAARVRAGQLSREEGRKKLFPLVKSETPENSQGLDQRIAGLRRKLALLEAAKKDPDALIRDRIDQLLGEGQAQPPGW